MYPPPLPLHPHHSARSAINRTFWLLTCLGALVLAFSVFHFDIRRVVAAPLAQSSLTSPDGLWTFLSVPSSQRQVTLTSLGLLNSTLIASPETTVSLNASLSTFWLPMPDGTFMQFKLVESPVLEPALSNLLTSIKSFRAEGVSDPSAYARLDRSPRGFHAFVVLKNGTVTIQPVNSSNLLTYVTYYGQNIVSNADFQCLTAELQSVNPPAPIQESSLNFSQPFTRLRSQPQYFTSIGGTRRNYRIAIATTQEYTNNANLGGGSVTNALASLNTWLNAVNVIYERDLAVHLNLVANNSNVIYTSTSDPFTNGDVNAMLVQVRTVLRDVIGTANFDVGHVLGTGNSGLSYIGVVCNGTDVGDAKGPLKAGGVSLIDPNATVGDTFFMTRIAHELGHQFGANHSFNDTDFYASSRSASTAYESGSGLTIMSYAGAGTPIVASGARATHFHGGSIGEITSYVSTSATCYTSTSLSNSPPTVNAGADYTIPRNTPFKLTATASDADAGDVANLTYSWEQMDAGGASYGQGSYSDASDPSTTTRPIFRPFAPGASPSRTFPSLTYILNNANVPPATINDQGFTVNSAENLPNITRTLNFRVTVRDGRGGVSDDGMVVNVDGNSGPFAVTAPNTAVTWAGGTTQTVTWNVANTTAAPVSCANVKITLSTDGGVTFPITLAASTPNDGSEAVTLPNGYSSTQARVKVEAVNNIFFDISNTNFTLTSGVTCSYTFSPTSYYFAPGGGAGGFSVTNTTGCSWSAISNAPWLTVTSGSGTGNGTVTFTVSANGGSARAGTISIGSTSFTVNQQASTCTYTASPTSASFSSASGTGSISVTRNKSGCSWSAWSNASWITITAGSSGTANGTVSYSVAANTGAARTGTLTVAGITVTISQSCGTTISPSSQTTASSGGTGSVSVSSISGCSWTAKSNVSWIQITAGASGSGNGTVSYSVSPLVGAQRTGTLTIGGNTFTVTQTGTVASNPVPTLTSLSPSSIKAGSAGFTLTVTGTNFVSGSVVRWGGSDRVTTFVSPTQLTASITSTDVKASATVKVTVFNPTPGGGVSMPVNFTVTK